MLSRRESSTLPWAWVAGLLPWVWSIPANQWFWDDWATAPLTGWDEQIVRWEGGAKHFLNPVVYFLLLPLGQWTFQLIMTFGALAAALALTQIMKKTVGIPQSLVVWVGPIFLALPVFHARFSAAVFEYMMCLTALLIAWAIFLSKMGRLRFYLSYLLLIFAIGVPSFAMLFPLIWIHVILQDRRQSHSVAIRQLALRHSPLLAVPILYALVFQVLLNTEGRYQISIGALWEFAKGLVVLVSFVATLVLWFRIRNSGRGRDWYWVMGSAIAAYLALFPYFAVGYNPLADFLPWRMRADILESASVRFASVSSLLLGIALATFLISGASSRLSGLRGLMLPSVAAASFGALVVVFGPMDWESRHWILAWPFLAVFFTSIISASNPNQVRSVLISTFATLLVSSLIISSEYVVDVVKQRSIVRAVSRELRQETVIDSPADPSYVVVIENYEDANSLNARFRGYRPYEWWGLISRGLDIEPESLRVMFLSDVERNRVTGCDDRFRAVAIRPIIETSRFEALRKMRVDLKLNSRPISLCSLRVRDGWPRDPIPRSS